MEAPERAPPDVNDQPAKKRRRKKRGGVTDAEAREARALEEELFGASGAAATLRGAAAADDDDAEDALAAAVEDAAAAASALGGPGFVLDRGRGEEEATAAAAAPSLGGALGDDSEEEDEEEELFGGMSGRAGRGAVTGPPAAAWEDPDEEGIEVAVASKDRLRKLRQEEHETTLGGKEYVQRLRQQHAKLNPRTDWASKALAAVTREKDAAAAGTDVAWSDEDDGEGGAEKGLGSTQRDASALVVQQSRAAMGVPLPAGEIEATRVKDGNAAEPADAVIQSTQFHPHLPVLLTAGLDRAIRLYQVDGRRNAKLQGVFLDDCPIRRACFADGGHSVVASGRRPFFYVYHLQAGRVERVTGLAGRSERSYEGFCESPVASHAGASGGSASLLAFFGDQGHIPLVSLQTRQCVATLKMNGSVRCAAFGPDGNTLYSAGGDGEVYVWDIRTRRCVERMVDDGCVRATSLACAPDSSHFAVGSDSGVVNLYQKRFHARLDGSAAVAGKGPARAARPTPAKSFLNLTTSVDTLAFSADSQIMAMSSRMKKDALRLVHVPSRTVFANWPSSKTPIQFCSSLAFSPGGGYFAAGNARGRVLLYRFHHYSSY